MFNALGCTNLRMRPMVKVEGSPVLHLLLIFLVAIALGVIWITLLLPSDDHIGLMSPVQVIIN